MVHFVFRHFKSKDLVQSEAYKLRMNAAQSNQFQVVCGKKFRGLEKVSQQRHL